MFITKKKLEKLIDEKVKEVYRKIQYSEEIVGYLYCHRTYIAWLPVSKTEGNEWVPVREKDITSSHHEYMHVDGWHRKENYISLESLFKEKMDKVEKRVKKELQNEN